MSGVLKRVTDAFPFAPGFLPLMAPDAHDRVPLEPHEQDRVQKLREEIKGTFNPYSRPIFLIRMVRTECNGTLMRLVRCTQA